LRHASLFPSSADLDRFLFRRSFTSSGRTALSPPSTLLAVDSSTTVRRCPASSLICAVADLLSSHFFSLPRFLAFSTTTVPRYHSSDKTNVTAFPDGLKMLIGNPYARFLDPGFLDFASLTLLDRPLHLQIATRGPTTALAMQTRLLDGTVSVAPLEPTGILVKLTCPRTTARTD
jgi:hypothetical protein